MRGTRVTPPGPFVTRELPTVGRVTVAAAVAHAVTVTAAVTDRVRIRSATTAVPRVLDPGAAVAVSVPAPGCAPPITRRVRVRVSVTVTVTVPDGGHLHRHLRLWSELRRRDLFLGECPGAQGETKDK